MASDIRAQIEAAGERRTQALAIADSALNDVVDLIPEALAAGMTKSEIAALTGVSRHTLDAVLRLRRKQPGYWTRLPARDVDLPDAGWMPGGRRR